MMQTVLNVVCPDAKWGEKFKELLDSFPSVENASIKIEDMGTKEGWKEWALWK